MLKIGYLWIVVQIRLFVVPETCDTVRLSAYILCNIMSLYLNCCLELKIEILKYMFRFQGQAIDFSM